MDIYNVTSNLRRVCEELQNPDFHLDQHDVIALFHPIKPMLASRHPPEEVVKFMEGHPFTKFDGERIQAHKDGEKIELYTRNCNNCSHMYGSKLAPVIRERVVVSSCILDGELIVWDTITERFEEFGKLKSFATYARDFVGDSQAGPDSRNWGKQLCYVVFDVLFVKGQSLMSLTLQQRFAILKRIVNPKPKLLELVEQRPAKTTAEVITALDAAILNREEGIMLKNLDSTYVPGERKQKWLKLKPEYVDGIGDDLDVLILGGYYGTGNRRGGTISHFMIGVLAHNEEQIVFHSLAKVGTGYSDSELAVLQKQLEPHWRVFQTNTPPQSIQLAEGFKEKPDVWIEPQHSKIIQVKAAQIVPSDKYKAGFTLRFPRVVRFRADKDWNECLTLEELQRFAAEGRYAKRPFSAVFQKAPSGVTKEKKRRVQRTEHKKGVLSVIDAYRATDTSQIQVTSNIFNGVELCILNASPEHPKEELERSIVQCGGTKVQYPTSNTLCCIASQKTVKVKNLMEKGISDIADAAWLLACVSQNKLIPFEPKYMLFTTEATKQRFQKEVDRFGDSYTKEATAASLSEVFLQIKKQLTGQASLEDVDIDVMPLEQHYFPKVWWSIFRNYVFYFDKFRIVSDASTPIENCSLESTEAVATFFGATTSNSVTVSVTHIIMDKSDLTRVPELQRQAGWTHKFFVDKAWVEESAQQREDLDEAEFSPF
ncbi:DNA ligase IV [Pelomyxa schiedti]|nr:DNA ligase IV [Pelomyxa schiedti]